MKDLLLILVLLAAFAFCYYVMVKIDRFIDENQRAITDKNRSGQSKIRIAAENTDLLDAVFPALERCSNADPHLEFFLSRGSADRIMDRLLAEQVDLVLLRCTDAQKPDGAYTSLDITCDPPAPPAQLRGICIEESGEAPCIRVVWKRSLKSKDRDRVIFALENEYGPSDLSHRSHANL